MFIEIQNRVNQTPIGLTFELSENKMYIASLKLSFIAYN
jgi:hypothetical protein